MEFRPLAKNEVVKHVGAIHISNSLSLLERKVSNVLLRNAWDSLLTADVHTIKIRDLAQAVGFNSGDMELIKDTLRALRNIEIQWNTLGRDRKNVWTTSGILASIRIFEGSGVCEYSYPPPLRSILRNPNIFARLNLLIQRQFGSKYALALWEYASGELSLSADEGAKERCLTEWIAVEALRRLLGSENPAYDEYKIFNRDVLKPAVSEINRISNLEILETETQREKRKITALRFSIASKETYQLPLDLDPPSLLDGEPVAALPKEVNEEKAALVHRMMEAGVDEKGARGISRSYGMDRITENLAWAVAQIESGRDIKRPGAFIVAAIRNDYVAPERVKRKNAQQLRIDQKKAERDSRELEALVAKAEGDFWLYQVSRVDAVLAGYSAEQRSAFEHLMVERNVFHTASRWEEYRKNGLSAAPERSLFYAFAMRELLPPEERDILRYAQGQGMAADVITALEGKR